MGDVSKQQISHNKHAWLIPFTCLLVGGALIGVSTNLAKYANEIGVTPLAFLFWSITGAAIILLLVAIIKKELPPLTARSFEYYFVAALVSVAGSNLLLFSAIPHVGASFVALIVSLPPLLTYLGALMLRMERFNIIRALGVAAALTGAGVLAVRKFSAPDASIVWILLALCGPVLLAIGNIYRTLRWPDQASPNALAPGMLIAAALLLFMCSALPNFSVHVSLIGWLPLRGDRRTSWSICRSVLTAICPPKNRRPCFIELIGFGRRSGWGSCGYFFARRESASRFVFGGVIDRTWSGFGDMGRGNYVGQNGIKITY